VRRQGAFHSFGLVGSLNGGGCVRVGVVSHTPTATQKATKKDKTETKAKAKKPNLLKVKLYLRCGRNMNHPVNRRIFDIITKSENPVPRFIPKSNYAEFQSFALFQ